MRTLVFILASYLTLACGTPTLCDRDAVQVALDGAMDGAIVSIPAACRIEGALQVPDGVILTGGEGSVVAVLDPRGVAIELSARAELRGVRIESHGRAAVVARSGARIVDVDISLVHGLGVYAAGGDTTLSDVMIEGPVMDGSEARWVAVRAEPQEPADCMDCECAPGETDGERVCQDGTYVTWAPTIGVYLRDTVATLTDVSIRGIARYGLIADATELTWDRGGVERVVGVGVLLRDGTSNLTDVTVDGVVSGLRGIPSYSVLTSDGHEQTSTRLSLRDGERYGLLSFESTGSHNDLQVSGHGDAAVWVGASTGFSIRGESLLENNGLAGLVAIDSTGLELDGLVVRDVTEVRRSVGAFGVLEIGDGIQLSGVATATLRDVEVSGCERAGMLVDVSPGLTFEGVSVDASGDAFGALGGVADDADASIDITMPPGWDAGITRLGAAITNDVDVMGAFDALIEARPDGATELVGVVGPMY